MFSLSRLLFTLLLLPYLNVAALPMLGLQDLSLSSSVEFDVDVDFFSHMPILSQSHYKAATASKEDKEEDAGTLPRILSMLSIPSASYSCSNAFVGTAYSPLEFCSGVVDYAFYLPDGIAVADLSAQANALAANAVPLLSSSCLSDIKRVICASLYRPCRTPTSGNGAISYAESLPFKRPCKSLCTAQSSSCGPILGYFGMTTNCSTTEFDDSLSTCNALTSVSTLQLVQDTDEPYIGDVCRGITERVYLPPSSPPLAPLLPPFVMQSVLEVTLAALEEMIPKIMTPSCLLAQRKIVCGLFFMAPEPVSTLENFFGTVIFPKFPSKGVCETYGQQCAGLIALAPALAMNCSQRVGVAHMFPDRRQTIMEIDLGFTIVPIVTAPNWMNETTAVFETECPYGYVVPSDPTKSSIIWLPGTGCAIACPQPWYTPSQYGRILLFNRDSAVVAICIIVFLFMNALLTSPAKRNYYLVILGVIDFIFFVVQLNSVSTSLQTPLQDGYLDILVSACDTNASWTDSSVNQTCNFEGIMYYIFYWGNCYVFSCFIFELWLRIVLGMKKVTKLFVFSFLGAIFGTYWVVYIASVDASNIQSASANCVWFDSDTAMDMYLKPLMAFYFTVVALYVHVIVKCVVTSLNTSHNIDFAQLTKLWKSYRVLFLVGFVFIVSYMQLIVQYTIMAARYAFIVNNTLDWFTCLVIQFITPGQTQSSILATCGDTPSATFPYWTFLLQQTMNLFMALIPSVALLTADARNAYFTFFVDMERLALGTSRIRDSLVDVKIFQAFSDQRSTQVSSMDSAPESPVKFKPRPDMYALEEGTDIEKVLPSDESSNRQVDGDRVAGSVEEEKECDHEIEAGPLVLNNTSSQIP